MKHVLILMLVCWVLPAQAITKCKDADGKWHYGDVAVEECENSKITTLNERGFITDEQDAPKTEEQLKAEEEERALAEAEKHRLEAEAEERRRILSIYETEEDIDRQRDNQLNSISSNIDVHNAYLKAMDAKVIRYKTKMKEVTAERLIQQYKKQIVEAEERIKSSTIERDSLIAQKAEIMKKFAKEKELYLALKNSE
ncbi:MAG: DUF4124 domain-containing protein [Pseudomonadota bacterium]